MGSSQFQLNLLLALQLSPASKSHFQSVGSGDNPTGDKAVSDSSLSPGNVDLRCGCDTLAMASRYTSVSISQGCTPVWWEGSQASVVLHPKHVSIQERLPKDRRGVSPDDCGLGMALRTLLWHL